jgi:spore maturation protein CgeB
VLVASNVQEFIARVQQLLAADSPAVAQAGYQRILQNYAWEKNLSRIDRLLKGLRVLRGSDTDGHRTIEKAQPSRKR